MPERRGRGRGEARGWIRVSLGAGRHRLKQSNTAAPATKTLPTGPPSPGARRMPYPAAAEAASLSYTAA